MINNIDDDLLTDCDRQELLKTIKNYVRDCFLVVGNFKVKIAKKEAIRLCEKEFYYFDFSVESLETEIFISLKEDRKEFVRKSKLLREELIFSEDNL